jgi:diguanylate cyclase (GGDEF)-like protein
LKDRTWEWILLPFLPSLVLLALLTNGFSRPIGFQDLIAPAIIFVLLQLFLWQRKIRKPVNDFINAIRRAINGDYQARFSCEDGSALKRLSVAYNQLMSCVESQMDELSENRVLQNQMYENEKIYRSALELTCERVFEADLSHNRVLYGCEKYANTFPFLRTEIYDEMVRSIAEHAVSDKDAKLFRQTFSQSSLLKALRRLGVPEVSMDYRLRNKSGEFVWYSASVIFLNSGSYDGLKIIGYVKNINERKKQEIEILNQSQKDGLTGLYNKKVTENMIDSYLSGEGQSSRHAVIMVDIDNFKLINDSFGHTQGDIALTKVSQKLQSLFRTTDIVGRVGGDEFLVLMKNVTDSGALLEKLKSIGRYFREIRLDDESYRIHGSIGVSLYPDDGICYITLFKKADMALYYSKAHGKDQYYFFDSHKKECSDTANNGSKQKWDDTVPRLKPIESTSLKQR